ncbi:MBL fold metallo-hydrolase [Rhodoplanes azumiensis]|uniref:MBL fold metallo-hydrolase n=1 Tax=Rhodoplanes azumiensis TaxID=1897628 RepID=A0ABW5AP04_9BRAD
MPATPARRATPVRSLVRFAAFVAVLILGWILPIAAMRPAVGQPAAPAAPAAPERLDTCPGLVSRTSPRIVPAAVVPAALAPDQARVTYIGHSTFLIESPRQVRVATDYNDYVKPPVVPDIATMNRAHSTHYTLSPDPGIRFVLHGWRDDGKPAGHDISYQDVHVRSVATNIRDWAGGTARHGNSIFVIEVGTLCIAHLGHLHHTLTPQQVSEIGRVDVVLVPVDGSYTLDLEGMIEVIAALKAPLMIPMHFFSRYTLDRFLERVKSDYEIEFAETPTVVLSKTTLPAKPKFLVLPGR